MRRKTTCLPSLPMRTLTIALLGALTGAKVRAEDEYVFGADCDKTDAAVIKMRVNYFPTEWGLYEVEGCTGVAPKLHLSAGKTYTFNQGHQSNWCAPPLVLMRRAARVEALPPAAGAPHPLRQRS